MVLRRVPQAEQEWTFAAMNNVNVDDDGSVILADNLVDASDIGLKDKYPRGT